MKTTGIIASFALGCLLFAAAPGGVFKAEANNGGGPPAVFVAGFEDLPLMPALVQSPESAMVFSSPYGRIMEAWASGHTRPAAVLSFYAATLPQLGWQQSGDRRFLREGEELVIDISEHGHGVSVRFRISPAG